MISPTGTVLALFRVDEETKKTVQETSLQLEEKGIVYDKHFGKDSARSILFSSQKSYALVKDAIGVEMPIGYLGENILVDVDLYDLPIGTRLRIGKEAVVEITQNCTLCSHLGALDSRIPRLLKHDRGIFAKTVHPGTISLGDKIIQL